MSVLDKQVGGDHYKKHKIQPWEIMSIYNLDHWTACALKYILRHRDKDNPKEDLEKAIHYLEYAISRLEGKDDNSG